MIVVNICEDCLAPHEPIIYNEGYSLHPVSKARILFFLGAEAQLSWVEATTLAVEESPWFDPGDYRDS